MKTESERLLAWIADETARQIIAEHGKDAEALFKAIARLALVGLESAVRSYAIECGSESC